jgi:hypothetical protein
MIFELEFLRYGKHDNHPVKIARRMEIAPDVEAVKARVRRLPGTAPWDGSLGLWLGLKRQKLLASWIMRDTRSRRGVGAKMKPKRSLTGSQLAAVRPGAYDLDSALFGCILQECPEKSDGSGLRAAAHHT